MTRHATATGPGADPDLTRAAAALRALATAVAGTTGPLPDGVPDPEAAAARLAGGVPALHGEPLMRFEDVIRAVDAAVASLGHTEASAEAGRSLITTRDRRKAEVVLRHLRSLGDGKEPECDLLVRAALEGSRDPIEAVALRAGVDPDLLVTLLDWAARPALRGAAAALAPVLHEARWSRGRCPACGAPPVLSVLNGKERERRLACGRCGAAWAFERVRCPACGERDHRRLGYLHAEGEGEYRRAEVCDACRSYVKSVSQLDRPDAERLLELDLETAALDFLALDAGYTRGAPA